MTIRRSPALLTKKIGSGNGSPVSSGGAIVHRDLKPDNVIIVADPEAPGGERAKVLDFGIAEVRFLFGDGELVST